MKLKRIFFSALPLVACTLRQSPAATPATQPFAVEINVDAAKPTRPLKPIWRFFGYDEANYTYMKDGQALLSELGALGREGDTNQVFARCHDLLTSGDGIPGLKWSSTNAYTETADGKPIYDWTIVDRIFDTYIKNGIRPYAQIGFMPEAMSIHPQDYPHDPPREVPLDPKAGEAYPPKDYAKWGELVHQWVLHCVQRYGADQVKTWYWEVWNEPNISYWQGSHADYFKLYDYATDGVLRALPGARVGGPETAGGAGGKFMGEFLQHCADGTNAATGKKGAPLDFMSFHAKGSPTVVDGHVRMGMRNQLNDMDRAFAVIASFPQFKDKPIVIGESDPEGCAACRGPKNAYRNGTMYSSYTAASFPRAMDLADKHGVNLEGALTWAFEFEDEPYFAGFRALATNGIDLPVLNVFRMFAKMDGQRLPVNSDGAYAVADIQAHGVHDTHSDVSALASIDDHRVCLLVWNYDDDDVAGPEAQVKINLATLPWKDGTLKPRQFCIDADHSNSYAAWQKMGSPQKPDAKQYAQLKAAGQLAEVVGMKPVDLLNHMATVTVTVPREGVTLVVLDDR